jgi:hypothetical protein
MNTHRWQYLKRGEREVIIGNQSIKLDPEGFFEEEPHIKLLPKLQAMEKRGAVRYVALDNETLWNDRLDRAFANVKGARAEILRIERELIRAHDFERTCEDQVRELEAERARYRSLISGEPARQVEAEPGRHPARYDRPSAPAEPASPETQSGPKPDEVTPNAEGVVPSGNTEPDSKSKKKG